VAQVASAAALRRGHDSAWLYYRDLGVGLALGVTPYELFLGALARAADPHSGGRQLTAHLSSPRLRIGTVSSEVGAHLPHAVGAAYAARVRDEDAIAACWFGDGATSEGGAHEAMNLAATRRLPVVFLCENNGYAISVPVTHQMGVASVSGRAAGYGMPGTTVDGTDAVAVHLACVTAVDRARAGDGPSLVELCVPRMTPHSSQDDDGYRSAAEVAAAQEADPLPRLRAHLIDNGMLTAQDDKALADDVRRLVLADAERALQAGEPDAGRARRWLFAGDPAHEGPPGEPGSGVFDD
jgi:2-oxoisovalerate dehydrogenase E1 component alpha subunit